MGERGQRGIDVIPALRKRVAIFCSSGKDAELSWTRLKNMLSETGDGHVRPIFILNIECHLIRKHTFTERPETNANGRIIMTPRGTYSSKKSEFLISALKS